MLVVAGLIGAWPQVGPGLGEEINGGCKQEVCVVTCVTTPSLPPLPTLPARYTFTPRAV